MNLETGEVHVAESFLIADLGSSHTAVSLFDVVEGAYRFVAQATAPCTTGAPWHDVTSGVQQAIAQLSQVTRRPLLDKQGWLITPMDEDKAGVDQFAATVSAADPLRVISLGLLDEVSLASARRALHSTYVQEVDQFSLTDPRGEQEQVTAILKQKPDVIFISGGTDGGDSRRVLKLVESVALGLDLLAKVDIHRPQVVYAGNRALREKVTSMLGGMSSLHVVDNVRPSLEVEQLHDAARLVNSLYEDIKVAAVPGIERIASWSNFPLMPTAQAFAAVNQYFAALSRGRVYGFDVGSDSVSFVAAQPGQARLSVRADVGLGRPLEKLLGKLELSQILFWNDLEEVDSQAVDNYLQGKALYGYTVPMTEKELHLEQAVTRALLLHVVEQAASGWGWPAGQLPPCNLLLLAGAALAHAPRPEQALLMVLDAVQPSGMFSVALDRYGVLPALGLLAPHRPLVTVQALEGGVLHDLGWVIAPSGRAQPGQRALRIRLESPELGRLDVEVEAGCLEVLPLPAGQPAMLSVMPSRRFDIGFGPGQGRRIKVHGGSVGIVVDARGRPLSIPGEARARRSRLRQWRQDLGG